MPKFLAAKKPNRTTTMINRPTAPLSFPASLARWMQVCTLAILVALVPAARAQNNSTGSISGTVLNSTTGNFLEGAEVVVQTGGASYRTNSERGGRFTLSGVPAGAHTLVVSYPGLDVKSEPVTVVAGQAVTVPVSLGTETIMLEAMKISTTKEGMAQAQALQRVSIQAKLVAAADQFGEVSEGNIGEYLKFLPGVSVDYNVNDARGISLRGLSTAFTIVAVDGTPMAGTSSMDDTRRFEFEQIAMNNVETTELFKTVTPDIPASSTGGFVNFVTKSAFDSGDIQRFSYNASLSAPSTNLSFSKEGGVWGHNKEFLIRPSLELNYARRLNEKVGINFNYRLSEKYDDSPRTTATWNVQPASNPTIFAGQPRLGTYAIRSEQKLTHREAFASKLDYKISDATTLSLSGQWNWYDLNFTQRGPVFAFGTSATANGDSYTSGTGAAVTAAQAGTITNGVLYRNKYGTTYHSNATLTHEFSATSKASLTAYYSRADGHYRDTSKGFISSASTMVPGPNTYSSFTLTGIGRELPSISLTQGGTPVPLDFIRSLANYSFGAAGNNTNFQSRPWTALDTKKGVNGSYSLELDQLPLPVKLETGFAFDDTLRYISRPDLRGVFPAITGSALTALADPNYNKDVAYGFGNYQVVDPFKVWEAYKPFLTFVSADDIREFSEKNNAGYLRADVNVTPSLLLIGGFRWEQHTLDAKAQSRANARSKLAMIDLDYSEWYPSLSFKYTPRANRNIVVRGGISRTVGHPDYADVLPTITSESEVGTRNGIINVPDPKLEPYFSTNMDLSVDFYFKHSGVASIYGFRKDVKNYFVSRSMTQADINTIAADYGYNPAEFASGAVTANGGKSSLQGVELSYAQNMTFLPKPFNGLNVQANFTYLDVQADDPDPLKALDLEYSQLRAVSPKTANFILGYRYRNFSVTSTTNWVSESLFGGFVATTFFTGTAGNPTTGAPDTRLAIYRDEKATTDLKMEYAINKNIAVYFLIRNIFNSQRLDYFRGYLPQNQHVVLPNNRYEFGEPHLTLGVRGRF
jgi:iron complex outermembrane recepter protein